MRRKDREITDPATMSEIIQAAEYCTLSMCDGDVPYGVIMNYGFAENCFYFHCANEGRKLEILQRNPQVCIQLVGDAEVILSGAPTTWTTRYRSVVATGLAEIVSTPEEKQNGIDILLKHYSGRGCQFPPQALDAVTIIKVPVDTITAKGNTT